MPLVASDKQYTTRAAADRVLCPNLNDFVFCRQAFYVLSLETPTFLNANLGKPDEVTRTCPLCAKSGLTHLCHVCLLAPDVAGRMRIILIQKYKTEIAS